MKGKKTERTRESEHIVSPMVLLRSERGGVWSGNWFGGGRL